MYCAFTNRHVSCWDLIWSSIKWLDWNYPKKVRLCNMMSFKIKASYVSAGQPRDDNTLCSWRAPTSNAESELTPRKWVKPYSLSSTQGPETLATIRWLVAVMDTSSNVWIDLRLVWSVGSEAIHQVRMSGTGYPVTGSFTVVYFS